MPYGVYKKGEEFEIYYSACEETLKKDKEIWELIGIYPTKEDAERAKYQLEMHKSLSKK